MDVANVSLKTSLNIEEILCQSDLISLQGLPAKRSKEENEGANMASIEQELMVMLKQLPVPITITWQSNRYHWECLDGHGSSTDLVEATRQGLNYMIASLQTDLRPVSENINGSKA